MAPYIGYNVEKAFTKMSSKVAFYLNFPRKLTMAEAMKKELL